MEYQDYRDLTTRRQTETDKLKAISYSINADVSDLPLAHCLTSSDNLEEEKLFQEELLAATSLALQDLVKSQQEDDTIAEVKRLIQ